MPVAEAARALAPLALERLEQLGLVAVGRRRRSRALVRIVPHDEILIASDRRLRERRGRGRTTSPACTGPSLTLSHLTVRRPVETALDVGTGYGIQAILASRHSERVLATDVNERALGFAAFNAALNGVENVELRAGQLLRAGRGQPLRPRDVATRRT